MLFLLYIRVHVGTVRTKKLAKLLLFFDMTKYFLKKMQKIFIFFEFAMFG